MGNFGTLVGGRVAGACLAGLVRAAGIAVEEEVDESVGEPLCPPGEPEHQGAAEQCRE
jgi:hypothetical protein